MYVRYALLADGAVPGGAGKWNIIGTFNTLWVKSFPATHARLSLIIRLEFHITEAGQHALEVELVDQDGNRLGGPPTVTFELDPGKTIPGTPPGVEIALEAQNVQFQGPGNYEFAIKVDGTYLDSAPLYVRDQADRRKLSGESYVPGDRNGRPRRGDQDARKS